MEANRTTFSWDYTNRGSRTAVLDGGEFGTFVDAVTNAVKELKNHIAIGAIKNGGRLVLRGSPEGFQHLYKVRE